MKILIAEDDFVSRKFIFKFMSQFGDCDVTVDGMEAIEVFLMSLEEGDYYDLVCLDIMMPEVDGIKALKTMRKLEEERNIPESKTCQGDHDHSLKFNRGGLLTRLGQGLKHTLLSLLIRINSLML